MLQAVNTIYYTLIALTRVHADDKHTRVMYTTPRGYCFYFVTLDDDAAAAPVLAGRRTLLIIHDAVSRRKNKFKQKYARTFPRP